MKSPILVLAMLTACGGGNDGGAGDVDDCTVVTTDRVHAMTRLASKYAGEPVKMQEALEHCLAPTGSDCERVAKLFGEMPAMIPKWSKIDQTNAKAICSGMPPVLQKCLLPSYVIGHRNECTGAPGAARAAAATAAAVVK